MNVLLTVSSGLDLLESKLSKKVPQTIRWYLGVLLIVASAILTNKHVLAQVFGTRASAISWWSQVSLMALTALTLLLVYRRFLKPLLRYMHDHLFQALLLLATVALVYGAGEVFEIPDLIWGVSWTQRILSGTSVTIVFALLGINAFHLDGRTDLSGAQIEAHLKLWGSELERGDWLEPQRARGQALSRFLRAVRLPFLLAILMPAICRTVFTRTHRLDDGLFSLMERGSLCVAELFELLLWAAGILGGVMIVKVFLWFADKIARYVEAISGAAAELGTTFRSQLGVIQKKLLHVIHFAWDALVYLWYLGRQAERAQLLPVARTSTAEVPEVDITNQTKDDNERKQAMLSFTAVFAIAYGFISWFLADYVSPGFAIFTLIGIAAAFDGLFRMLVPYRLRVGFVLLLLVWIGYAKQNVYELQFDNLSYDDRTRVELARHDPRIEEASPTAKTREDENVLPEFLRFGPRSRPSDNKVLTPQLRGQRLVSNNESLQAWKSRMQKGTQPRHKLVVVACSGGGIRSAQWTATALTWLDTELRDLNFRDSLRLISASSAGSVGASYFVKWLYDQHADTLTPDLQRLPIDNGWLRELPAQSLGTIASDIALREVPRILQPFDGRVQQDRGKLLESSWAHLRELPFEELRELERTAQLPSLVLAPMVAEDGRRLFLSNLDLSRQAITDSERKNPASRRPWRNLSVQRGEALFLQAALANTEPLSKEERQEVDQLILRMKQGLDLLPIPVQQQALGPDLSSLNGLSPVFSVSGLEFFKVFSRDKGFRLATAARMTATFPVVTPAVYLPSIPAVRIVDSGFRDNYGVELAADWIFQNREWLQEKTSGVVLIQLRCFDDTEKRQEIDGKRGDWLGRGYQFLGSVPQAAANTFRIGSAIRNDREISQLDSLLNESRTAAGKQGEIQAPFFTTVVFELPSFVRRIPTVSTAWPKVPEPEQWEIWEPVKGSLSWSLTNKEAAAIHEHALPRTANGFIPSDEDRQRILDTLARQVHETEDETTRLAYLWEYGRARNYERLRALRSWWESD